MLFGPPISLDAPYWPPKVVVKLEDVEEILFNVLHLPGSCSNLGQDPNGEYQAHDDDVAPGRNNDGLS